MRFGQTLTEINSNFHADPDSCSSAIATGNSGSITHFSLTMCDIDAYFKGAVDLGELGLGSPGSTCSSTSEYLLGKVLNLEGSDKVRGAKNVLWSYVTCDTLASTVS